MLYKIDNFFTTEYVEDFLLVRSDMSVKEMVSAISACADSLGEDRGIVVDLSNDILFKHLQALGCENVKDMYFSQAKKTYAMGFWSGKVTRKYSNFLPDEALIQVDLYGLVHGVDTPGKEYQFRICSIRQW